MAQSYTDWPTLPYTDWSSLPYINSTWMPVYTTPRPFLYTNDDDTPITATGPTTMPTAESDVDSSTGFLEPDLSVAEDNVSNTSPTLSNTYTAETVQVMPTTTTVPNAPNAIPDNVVALGLAPMPPETQNAEPVQVEATVSEAAAPPSQPTRYGFEREFVTMDDVVYSTKAEALRILWLANPNMNRQEITVLFSARTGTSISPSTVNRTFNRLANLAARAANAGTPSVSEQEVPPVAEFEISIKHVATGQVLSWPMVMNFNMEALVRNQIATQDQTTPAPVPAQVVPF